MMLNLDFFSRYKKVAIISTSNSLCRRKDKLGLIYYSVAALKSEINKFAPLVEVDLLDSKKSDEIGVRCIYDADKSQYDAVVMMNHTSAFFAGTLPKPFRDCMMFLNGYEGDVWWCYDTPAYFPTKTHVELIKHYGKYSYKPYNAELSRMLEDQSFISSLDDIDKRINIISDICIEDIPQCLVDATDYSRDVFGRISKTFYVKSNTAKAIGTSYKSKDPWESKKHDICLAFNYDNYRFSLAKKYVNNESLDVISLRHSPGEGFRCKVSVEPRIHNIEKYYEWLEENCYASLLVTTRNHLSCLVPERFYGVFNAYVIGFIPVECDPEKKWVKNEELRSFSYISSSDELAEKVLKTHDKDFFNHIVNLQRNEIA